MPLRMNLIASQYVIAVLVGLIIMNQIMFQHIQTCITACLQSYHLHIKRMTLLIITVYASTSTP